MRGLGRQDAPIAGAKWSPMQQAGHLNVKWMAEGAGKDL